MTQEEFNKIKTLGEEIENYESVLKSLSLFGEDGHFAFIHWSRYYHEYCVSQINDEIKEDLKKVIETRLRLAREEFKNISVQ